MSTEVYYGIERGQNQGEHIPEDDSDIMYMTYV